MKREWKSNNATEAQKVAATMPPRRHFVRGTGNYDVRLSEVVDWLCRQPEIRQALFNHYKDCGAIAFDAKTGEWFGVEYNPPRTPPASQ